MRHWDEDAVVILTWMSRLRVFITSCETGPEAWTAHEDKLKSFYELSDKRYTLAASPQAADIILIGNVREEHWGKQILQHELIKKHPGKSFSLSDADHPMILHHGIYASGTKSIFNFGRVRTGSYTLGSDEWLNPYIQAHRSSDPNSVKKEYLLTFVGRSAFSSRQFMRVRDAVFNMKFERPDVFIEDSSRFNVWSLDNSVEKRRQQRHYYDVLLRSKFCLCPRGEGASSMRLFEALKLGVAPVIVSDHWIFPRGPRWHEFSIIIKEKHIGRVERVVEAHEHDYRAMGALAARAFEEHFSERVYFNYVVDNCREIARRQIIPEALCWKLSPLVIASLKTGQTVKSVLRQIRDALRGGAKPSRPRYGGPGSS